MNSHPPTIQVKDAVIENNASFHTYTLAGTDEKGEFYARRRFSDFLKLREGMVVEWPGCYIPSLPDKKLIVNQLGQHRATNNLSSCSTEDGSCSTSVRSLLGFRIFIGLNTSSWWFGILIMKSKR